MSPVGPGFGFWHRLGLALGTRDDSGPIDFAVLERRISPNDCLVALIDLCGRAKPDLEPPLFPMPDSELGEKLRAIALAEPRTQAISCPTPNQLRFVQRSRLLRYPDIIDAMIVSRGAKASSVALYSRSLVGRGDLGVNRQRLERWLRALAA